MEEEEEEEDIGQFTLDGKRITFLEPHLPKEKVQEMFNVIYGLTEEDCKLFKPHNYKDAYMYSDAHTVLQYDQASESERALMSSFYLLRDRKFQTNSFLAWHSYGRCWTLFKPDLSEVIYLLYAWWEEHGKPQPLIVQTICYPSNDSCYNETLDRHCGKTTIWWPIIVDTTQSASKISKTE